MYIDRKMIMKEEVSKEKVYFDAYVSLFDAIRKLCVFYRFDQAVEIMNMYLKDGDVKVLTRENGIRDFVVASNLREILYPVITEKYGDLYGFFNEQLVNKSKNSSK